MNALTRNLSSFYLLKSLKIIYTVDKAVIWSENAYLVDKFWDKRYVLRPIPQIVLHIRYMLIFSMAVMSMHRLFMKSILYAMVEAFPVAKFVLFSMVVPSFRQ
jgi:hypothetical protein